jgi:hypothetical protein
MLNKIPGIPTTEELNKMTSSQIEALSAALTSGKNGYMAEYKAKQNILQNALSVKLENERLERIKNDPNYWEKHQGVGMRPRRFDPVYKEKYSR